MHTDWTQDANCQAAWLCREGTGETIEDSSQNSNEAIFRGTPVWTNVTNPPYAPYSIYIDDSAYVDCGYDSSIENQVFSKVTWLQLAADGFQQTIIGGFYNNSPQFGVTTDRKLFLDKTGVARIGTSNNTVPYGYCHVAVTYDTGGNYIFYVNAVADGSGTNLQIFAWDEVNIWGTNNNNDDLSGYMTEVAEFDDILTPTEIKEIYDFGLKPSLPILTPFWYYNG